MTTHGRSDDEPDSSLEPRDLCGAFDAPPPLDPELREAMARRLESRVRRARVRLIVSVSVACGMAVAAVIGLFVWVPSRTPRDAVAQIHETLRPEPEAGAFRAVEVNTNERSNSPEAHTLGHRAPVDAVVDPVDDAVESPDAAVAPPDEPNPLETARMCLRRGDNACVIAALEGGQWQSVRGLSLLIATYRVMGNSPAAMRHMQTFIERFPNDRRASRYREYLQVHEGSASAQPRRPPRHRNTRATKALFESLLGSRPTVDSAPVPHVDAGAHALNSDVIRRVISSNRPSVQRCYDDRARIEAAPPAVRFDMVLTIARSGRVTRAEARGTDWNGMAACLRDATTRWMFPASDRGTTINYPFTFSRM